MSTTQLSYSVFLSHNHRDKDFIERLAHKLKHEGLLPWFDKWELIPGNKWTGGSADGVNASATFAVFIGPHGLGDWEAEELDLAQTRAVKDDSFRMIPILLPGSPDPFDQNSLPPYIKNRTWVDFRKGIEDARAFFALVCGIKGVAPRPESVRTVDNEESTRPEICPYRGLQVFNEADHDFYFGRAADIQRLVEKLKGTRFLGVLGASGSGKSSLVRAGLLHSLSTGELPGSEAWQFLPVFSPGSSPLEALVLTLAKLPASNTDGLLGLLRDSDRALHAALNEFIALPANGRSAKPRVLLVVDQLEEIFTLCDQETDRSRFLANLLYAGSVPHGRCVVVLTMRADFYHKTAAYPEFAAALAEQQFLVSAMQREGLLQAIREPAEAANLQFEPGLVEAIADDVSNQPGALPLLEHALLELWRRCRNHRLTFEGYLDTGRVQGAIAKRAAAIYEGLNDEEQLVMKRIMLRLTQPGEGTEDTRRPASFDELITRLEDTDTVERIVAILTKPEHRLLTVDVKAGVRTVEVSHEALIRGWDTLRTWIDEDREGLGLYRRISDSAKDWKEQRLAGRSDTGLLYSGWPLARALEWRRHHDEEMNALDREFLDKGAAAEREAKITRLLTFVGWLVLIVIAIAGSLYLVRNINRSISVDLAAKSREATDPRERVILALSGFSYGDTPDARQARKDAWLSVGATQFFEGERSLPSAAFSADGKQVMITENDESDEHHTGWIVRLFDLPNSELIHQLKGAGVIKNAVFSPDGTKVAICINNKGGVAGVALVWDLSSGIQTQLPHGKQINSAAFSPDGNQLVTAGDDKTAWLWDLTTQKKKFPLQGGSDLGGHTDALTSVAFSPDGTRILTGSLDRTARLWDSTTGKALWALSHTSFVTNVAFSPDGKESVTASTDKIARIWDLTNLSLEPKELKGHTGEVTTAAFSPDGKLIVTASADGSAKVWDSKTVEKKQEMWGHTGVVNTAAFNKQGTRVLTAGNDKNALLWDVKP
jgi:WD40 repeat protein